MTRGFTIFRLGGFSITVDPSLLFVLAILGYDPNHFRLSHLLAWVGVVAGCILVHELGHALAFAAFGATPKVLLYGMGGVTSASGTFTAARSVIISLAGPVAGFGLGGLFYLAGPGSTELSRTVQVYGLYATFGFGVLNLLPVLPLDGGQVMLSVLKLGRIADPERVARMVSIGVAVAGGLLAMSLLNLGFTVLLLPLLLAGQNYADLRRMRDEPTRDRVREAFNALLRGRPADSARLAAEVLAERPGPDIAEVAAETLVWSHLALGRVPDARQALALRPGRAATDRRPVERLPEAAVALAEGAGEPAVAVIAGSLDKGEWAPPNVLIPLLERTGALEAVRARLNPDGAALLAKLEGAL